MEFMDRYDYPEPQASEDSDLQAAIFEKIELFGIDSDELTDFLEECGILRAKAISKHS